MSQILNNRYSIIQKLGEGGFGDTFLAEDAQMPSRRKCVIKQLKPVTQNLQLAQLIQQRFEREAALLEDLGRHSQIPTLYAYFQEGNQFYLIQELVEGKTLSNKIAQEGLMNENAVRDFLKNILPVLNFVHNKRIVHRDIKPDNIIIRYSDGMPVLIDFGAVKESLGTIVNSQGQTANSIAIGTPGFMPSEQAAGRPVFSSDLYSIGLTAIYLLTGKFPQEFDVDPRTGEILWRQHAPHVTPVLASVLDRAIRSHAPERFASAREMLDALQSGNVYNYNSSSSSADVPPTVVGTRQPNSVPPPVSNQQPGYQTPQPQNPYQQPGYQTPQPQNPYQQPPYPVNPYQSSGLVGGGGTFNTSAPVPPEIQGWNWGAFTMPHFWLFSNQVWIGLLTWVPFVNLVMPFILGAKGNTWAWRSRTWSSLEEFKSHQRKWALAGIAGFIPVFILQCWIFTIYGQYNSIEDNSDFSSSSTPRLQTSSTPKTDSTPIASPSPTTFPSRLSPVEIGQLEAYRYETGLFSVDVPREWTLRDQTTSNQILVGWLDKNENGAIFVTVVQNSEQLSEEELGKRLKDNVASSFNSDDLTVESVASPVRQPNGSVRVTFILKSKSLNESFVGNSFIEQKSDKISIFAIFVPQAQYSELLTSINQVIGSYTFDGTAPLN
jgi:serine/threonine-protein kinase